MSFAGVAISRLVAVANIVLFAIHPGLMMQFDPGHLNVASVIIPVTGIEVEHGPPYGAKQPHSLRPMKMIMGNRHIGGNPRSDGVGPCEVERVLGARPSRTGG